MLMICIASRKLRVFAEVPGGELKEQVTDMAARVDKASGSPLA